MKKKEHHALDRRDVTVKSNLHKIRNFCRQVRALPKLIKETNRRIINTRW